jgi:hypothetical protein
MNESNCRFFFCALGRYWIDPKVDPDEFHVALLKLLAKKGDLSLPKNWRPICLLDLMVKITSSIINARLDKYLSETVGLKEQFGFSSGRGCVDATAALKIALQNLNAADQAAFVVFVDLVKAFDSVNREMLWKILAKFGLPTSLITVIRKMYDNFHIKCDVNGIIFTIKSTSGVKQGDNLAPVLFLFAIQAALESMAQEWPAELPKLEWCPELNKNGAPRGSLTKRCVAKTHLRPLEFNRSLFADDAAFIFTSRLCMILGTTHITKHFKKFGLEVHLGKKDEDGKKIKSKTEFMHIPVRGKTSLPLDIADFDVIEGRHISHCASFVYLGSNIATDLDDTADITTRRNKGFGAFNQLAPVLLNKKIDIRLRANLYQSLVVNVVLWGCDSWAVGSSHHGLLDSFHNHCIRRLCNMTRYHHQYHGVRMGDLLERVRLPQLSSTLRLRQLRYLDKIATLSRDEVPRQLIACQATRPTKDYKFRKGSVLTTQSSYRSTLQEMGLCKPSDGGALNGWLLNILEHGMTEMIDNKLGLTPGTFEKGRRKPLNIRKNHVVRRPSANNQSV